jgi:hypothetical protein
MREHGGKDGTTGCGVLSRIAFPAAEATFGARWAARAGPVRGPPAATKFEDYTVLQIVVSSGACTRGATKIKTMYLQPFFNTM